MKNKILTAALAGGFLLFSACEKEQEMNSPEFPKSSMDVKMTDAPANYDVLLLAVSKTEVYQEGKGWIALDAHGETFNVLELRNGKNTTIAQSTNLEAGIYTKLRLEFKQDVQLTTMASIGMFGTQSAGTFTLNWQGSKIVEVEIDQKLAAGGHAEVILDFDAARSVIEVAGTYVIDPVIRWVNDSHTGIDGSIEGSTQGMVMVDNGQVEASTTFSSNGAFRLQGLKSGSYQVTIDYLVEVNGEMEYRQKTIDAVVVTEGEITHMGVITLE